MGCLCLRQIAELTPVYYLLEAKMSLVAEVALKAVKRGNWDDD